MFVSSCTLAWKVCMKYYCIITPAEAEGKKSFILEALLEERDTFIFRHVLSCLHFSVVD